jgi:hypothetical protein
VAAGKESSIMYAIIPLANFYALLTVIQLDYIQGMGFTAIWITPVTEQLSQDTGDGEAYHGYWQQEMSVALLSLNYLR